MSDSQANKFGMFKGVYTPSVLTILGVIMYLRMGWVVGNVGLFQTLVIVTISSIITFITALSISATATNMKVEGGGAYYMISRSLGVEIGAAVGIPLFLAQAFGISFYVVGFTESFISLFPDISIAGVSILCLCGLTALAYLSANLALKVQFLVLAAIILSLVSFFWGAMEPPSLEAQVATVADASFWEVFAVFFPAVTGILSGVAMSGDLKDPGKSLPIGTILAVITGYIVYMAIPICLYYTASLDVLKADPMVMAKISKVSQFFFLGIWGATLSSALGGLLGAPRTLQALAKDSVVFKQLSKTHGPDENPRLATLVTFCIAAVGILLGDLNAIAPVLSMFFLTSYGLLNFSAGIEGLIASPSWRPKFKSHWILSMIGAFLCSATMFMINPGATFLAGAAVIAVYYYMQRRNMVAHWEDMRHGILMLVARYSIYKLAKTKPNAKSWRPNFLVLSGAPTSRWYLIEFANNVTMGKGFLTVASVLQKNDSNVKKRIQFESSIREYMRKRRVSALVEVSLADDINDGLHTLVQTYGMGALAPNTVLLGETEKQENYEKFAEFIQFSYFNQKNVVIFREGSLPVKDKGKVIHVWWGRERQNAGLMLALAYMLQLSPAWKGAELYLNSIVKTEGERAVAEKQLNTLLAEGRLDIKFNIIIQEDWQDSLHDTIRKSSENADLVFIGMRPPDPDETQEEYCVYYRNIIELTNDLPATAITIATQDIDFAGIFVT